MTLSIGYILLAHQDPLLVARLAQRLLASGGTVTIHFDLNSGRERFEALRTALGADAERVHWPRRVEVAWGQWSIVQATLNGLEALERSGAKLDYVHLMSGTDYPTRPLADLARFLASAGDTDFIECADMSKEKWVRDGLTHERYQYRHWHNWKTHPHAFDRAWKWQRRLGLKRKFPALLRPHMGAQWWTLRWSTCQAVLKAGRDRGLVSFFKTVWIPDEMFIQTIVANTVPEAEIDGRCLTLYQFTDYGVPVVYTNGHAPYLMRQPFFFARKMSPYADRLRDELDRCISGAVPVPDVAPAAMGIRSPEYETHRLKWREPQPDLRLLGHDADNWRGDLAFRKSPVLALVGASREELEFVAAVLNDTGRILCHGELFGAERIGFVGNAERHAGYGALDLVLRDHKRTNFLNDIAVEAGPRTPGFCAPRGTEEGILDRLVWSDFGRILVVRGNVLRAYLEAVDREAIEKAKAARTAARHAPAAAPEVTKGPVRISRSELRKFLATDQEEHDKLRKLLGEGRAAFEVIDLTSSDWLDRLSAFVELELMGPKSAPVSTTPVLGGEEGRRIVAAQARRLTDPAERVVQALTLVDTVLEGPRREGHVRAMMGSAPIEDQSRDRLR